MIRRRKKSSTPGLRIGIFGGTFNPVHIGHTLLAQGALDEIPLDLVLWVPCRIPPHKKLKGDVSGEDRYRMVRLAAGSHPRFRVSRVELQRSGPSYTIDTVKLLQAEFPGRVARWYFLVGADSARQLSAWRQIGELRKRITFIAVPRPGQKLWRRVKGVRTILVKTLDISASDIRKRVKEGRSIRYLVPDTVRAYIARKGLYR